MVSRDIGQVGPAEGTAVVYDWKLYYNLPAAGLWGLLVAAIVLFKDNRNIRALGVLIPVAVVYLAWMGLGMLLGIPSAARSMFDQVAASLGVGLAVLWLMGHKIGGRNRGVSFLLAVVITVVVTAAAMLSYGGVEIGQESVVTAILFSVLILTVLLGIVMTSVFCRKRYGPWRFMLWLGLWTVVMGVVTTLGYFVVMTLVFRMGGGLDIDMLIRMLPQMLTSGLVLGAISYGLVIPFMILAFRNRLYRERLYGCLRLRGMTEERDKGTEAQSREKRDLRFQI